MMSNNLKALRGPAPFTAMLIVATTMLACAAFAQTAMGDPVDLQFSIINATSGDPGSVDRLSVGYVAGRENKVLDFEPDGSEFTVPSVPIKDVGQYIITVWHQGVPYWWSKRGRELAAGPITLHVFDTTEDRAGVTITGLNLVARRVETLVELEFLLNIDNAARPQVTVAGRPTFPLALPNGTEILTATYRRGPEPTSIETRSLGGGRIGLDVPLTPGASQIQVTARAPWTEGMELPLAYELPVASWSLLVAPAWVEIEAFEMVAAEEQAVPGYRRFTGPSLEADRRFAVRLKTGAEGETPEGTIFADSAADSVTVADEGDDEGGLGTLPFVFAGVLVIIVLITVIRRRG